MSRHQPIRVVKGMRDILPPDSALWGRVEHVAREVFRAYAYQEIRTPIVEVTELFARGVGQDTDIVTKEMYTFDDRDGSSLTLRPEATASVVRSYIENRMHERPGVKKLFYMGPMFRRERPQKGRYRQFYQIGAEAIGSESPTVDAEIIEMLFVMLNRLNLQGASMLVNSVGCAQCRPVFIERLRNELEKIKDQLCLDCQRRTVTNPLRVLDCKVPEDQPLIESLPVLSGLLCEGCKQHFDEVQSYLNDRKIPFVVSPRMVRGLDYYTRTTFEIVHGNLGAQNALLGGGRYDGLSEDLGGPPAPGIGFSIGEDRFILALGSADNAESSVDLYIAWMGEAAFRHAAELARELRSHNVAVEVASDPVKLKKSLEIASRLGAPYVLIVGDDEIAQARYALKNLSNSEQQTVSREELFQRFAGPAS
ncbi:MAG: histidine--tRNA ligase [Acidobacteria bacterium RIFCSPLOWO2_12_FULL_54_10]|nr:MAG: histidine--tRNA ligase [Acidobacteria bacterium RIFCSPLOWO2_12_FULL_54_10]